MSTLKPKDPKQVPLAVVADYGIVSTSDAYARTFYAQKQPANTTTPVTTNKQHARLQPTKIGTVTGQKRKNPSTRSRSSKKIKINNNEIVISMLNEDDKNSDGDTDIY